MKLSKIEVCKSDVVDIRKVSRVKDLLPDADTVLELSDLFKALSDATRLRIVISLSIAELCVCELATMIDVSVSAISHQLRILRGLKMVKFRREGKMVYYSLDDRHVETLINEAKDHINE